MNSVTGQKVTKKETITSKQRTYKDVVAYLDSHWNITQTADLNRMKKLDKACGDLSKKINAVLVAGTNGKSLTLHFATKLLEQENLKVGTFYAPHIINYNERITINHENIQNKKFTDISNEIIAIAEEHGIEAHSQEILTLVALKYFIDQKADVALLEVRENGANNPVNICHACVAAITRVTQPNGSEKIDDLRVLTHDLIGIIKKDTYVVSGDQNKANLQFIQEATEKVGGHWAMPIRKLAPLGYPFEQLHGRCASIAERIAQMYIDNFVIPNTEITENSLLMKKQGQRGRPTLEAKRERELNPQKTLHQFWKETRSTLAGKFQIIDKEKPSILLDNACNIDAFENLLLGLRLMHYDRPINGLVLIVSAAQEQLHNEEFLKLIRYFFKKVPGQLFVCPLENGMHSACEASSWNADQIATDIKSLKVKARAFGSFAQAFETAKKHVDERHGLIAISGSHSILKNYWENRGTKKLS